MDLAYTFPAKEWLIFFCNIAHWITPHTSLKAILIASFVSLHRSWSDHCTIQPWICMKEGKSFFHMKHIPYPKSQHGNTPSAFHEKTQLMIWLVWISLIAWCKVRYNSIIILTDLESKLDLCIIFMPRNLCHLDMFRYNFFLISTYGES